MQGNYLPVQASSVDPNYSQNINSLDPSLQALLNPQVNALSSQTSNLNAVDPNVALSNSSLTGSNMNLAGGYGVNMPQDSSLIGANTDLTGAVGSPDMSGGSSGLGDILGNITSDPNAMAGLGAALGLGATNGGLSNAQSMYGSAMGNFQNIYNSINPQDLQVALQQARMTNYNPAVLQSSAQVAPSAYQNVGLSQPLTQQQQSANAALSAMATGGATPQQLAAMNAMQNQTNAQLQSNLAGIQQSAAARGMGGSGQAMAMRAQAAQGAANQANAEAQGINSQLTANKMAGLQALQSALSSQQNQYLGAALGQAQGLQQNAQYGTTLNANIAGQNVGAQNQQQNLQTNAANQFAQYNTGIANQQAQQNQVNSKLQSAGVKQAAANGVLNGTTGAANAATKQGANSGAALGAGVGGLLSAASGLLGGAGGDVAGSGLLDAAMLA